MKVATLPTNRFDKMVGSCTQDLAMYLQKDNLESISIKRTICIYGSIEYISDMARVKKNAVVYSLIVITRRLCLFSPSLGVHLPAQCSHRGSLLTLHHRIFNPDEGR